VSDIAAALIYLTIVAVLVAGSIWFGMLVAPRIGRLMDSDDEGPGDDD
jgi:ABC-type Fe3+-siderophore transport system permease subunit